MGSLSFAGSRYMNADGGPRSRRLHGVRNALHSCWCCVVIGIYS